MNTSFNIIDSSAVFEEIQLRKKVNDLGDIRYYNKDGQLHRICGPAIVWSSGTMWWFCHGKRHRINGPAIEQSDGKMRWYINGTEYPEEDYWKEVERLKNGN